MTRPHTTEVWADSHSSATCRDCGQRITWATTVTHGKRVPFDGELYALQTKHNPDDRRLIEIVALDTCHFRTCPGGV